ncbi:MAG: hypothetical protein JXO49_11490 [Deltaproteobacteria bacterium]|nr:hypothetical protein [Candidatus Anaeroferrophillus wilburensis]MBN2889958.1 hypothetical protein [Deltaproteobacteria bacterium]
MVRAVDMQQMLLQLPLVSKVQHQSAHGAEVEQSKLVQQQLMKEEQQQRDIKEINEADRPLLDNNPRKEKEQPDRKFSQKRQSSSPAESGEAEEAGQLRKGGAFINITA